jgi:hypothetical protein
MAVTLPNRDARIKLFTRLLRDKKIDFSLGDGAVLLADSLRARASTAATSRTRCRRMDRTCFTCPIRSQRTLLSRCP